MSSTSHLKSGSRTMTRRRASQHPSNVPSGNQNSKPRRTQRAPKTSPQGDTQPPRYRRTTKDVASRKSGTFKDMRLKPELLRGLTESGFLKPTWIQEEAIPEALNDRSILARAKNGTGKTASFVIPILESFDKRKNYTQALIIVSTRELARQIADICKSLGKYCDVRVASVVGGYPVSDNVRALKSVMKPHIIVGTIGRLMHLAEIGVMDISRVTRVVIDEADETLVGDGTDVVSFILQSIETRFRMSLFSATYPNNLRPFINRWAEDVVSVNAMNEFTLRGVQQYYSYLEASEKVSVLKALLSRLAIHQCIIFCDSRDRCELLYEVISELFPGECRYIHGDLPQPERDEIDADFRTGKAKYLVATSVFDRGIDIPNVNVVINFDFPGEAPPYLHRIGRAGRYGQRGLAISLITDDDVETFKIVQQEIQAKIGPIPTDLDEIHWKDYAQ